MFFIVKTDDISWKLLNLLKEKAREGVSVRLMVDRIGGFRLNKKIRKELKQSGVSFKFSAVPKFPYLFYKFIRRNHRKITIIDQKIGYIGGYNIGKEYIGKDAKMGDWRDYHLRLTGLIVNDLAQLYNFDWSGNKEAQTFADTNPNHQAIKLEPTDGFDLEDVFLPLISSAKKEILIGTPYFIPNQKIMNALLDALNRGVSITLLVPMKADHPFVKEANIPNLKMVKEAGADVYLFDVGFYHAKVLMIDEQVCDLGTANLDLRSLQLNKEVNTILYDKEIIRQIRDCYLKDIKRSEVLTDSWLQKRNIKSKINGVIAKAIKPLL